METSHVYSGACLDHPPREFSLPAFHGRILHRKKWNKSNEFCKHMPLFLCFFFFFFLLLPARVSNEWDGVIVTRSDFRALLAIRKELNDPRLVLRTWNESSHTACSGGWTGIKCAKGQVIAIHLPWRGLGGRISEKISRLSALRKLSLHDNLIKGRIPVTLSQLHSLRGLHLFNNRLTGSIPASVGKCPSLQSLDLSSNRLTGSVPPGLFLLKRLYRINLSFNMLSGPLPDTLTSSLSLTSINLQHNSISGTIPNTWSDQHREGSYQLLSLLLAHNNISGQIPVSVSKLQKLQELSLTNNHITGNLPAEIGALSHLHSLNLSTNMITGSFPVALCNLTSLVSLDLEHNQLDNRIPISIYMLQNLSVLSLKDNRLRGPIPSTIGNISGLSRLDLSQNNLTGYIPASLSRLSTLEFVNVSDNRLSGSIPPALATKFNSSSFGGNPQLCGHVVSNPCPSPLSSSGDLRLHPLHHKLSHRDIILIALGSFLAVLFLICCILVGCLIKGRTSLGNKGGGASGTPPRRGEKAVPTQPTEVQSGEAGGKLVHFDGSFTFTADDLLCATAEIMGKSTFGTVYKATLEDGKEVAVKRLREKIAKCQREFETEVNALGNIRHTNLLALRAYYLGPKGEKLLVFDFMPKGSLASFLHARGPDTPIDWPTRLDIAIGTAKGLQHLHTQESIIHGNLTSGNVLLDVDNNPKISDFGLTRLMTAAANSTVIAAAGALGYRAPELSKLKKATEKTDIYSFGVILLELLTGRSPAEAMNTVELPQWVSSIVTEEWTKEVLDLELMRNVSTTGNELLNTLKLALQCTDPTPSTRPEIQHVVQQLQDIKGRPPAESSDGSAAASSERSE